MQRVIHLSPDRPRCVVGTCRRSHECASYQVPMTIGRPIVDPSVMPTWSALTCSNFVALADAVAPVAERRVHPPMGV